MIYKIFFTWTFSFFCITLYGQNLFFDKNYAHGKGYSVFGTGTLVDDYITCSDIQSDGTLFLAGSRTENLAKRRQLTIYKVLSSGLLDSSFGINGCVKPVFSGLQNITFCTLKCLPNGKFLLAGQGLNTVFISRFSANGHLDSTFGKNGFNFSDFSTADAYCHTMCLQPDSSIILGGSIHASSFKSFVVKYSKQGKIDSTFGNKSISYFSVLNGCLGWDLVSTPDSCLFICGAAIIDNIQNNQAQLIYKLTPKGLLDNSFNTIGYRIFDESTGRDFAKKIMLASDQSVILGGLILDKSNTEDSARVFIKNIAQDGNTVSTFNNDQPYILPSVSFGSLNKIWFDKGMIKILYNSRSKTDRILSTIFSLKPTGTADSTFFNTGMNSIELYDNTEYIVNINPLNDSNFIVSGYVYGKNKDDYYEAYWAKLTTQPSKAARIKTHIKPQFTLYPNPSSGKIQIRSNAPIHSIQIFNLQGQNLDIIQNIFSNNLTLNLAELNAGIYSLQIITNNEISTQQIQIIK